MITLLVFLIILSLLVFVHELGHFMVARKFGIRVDEFGLGFPPRAFGMYKDENGKWIKVAGNKEVKNIPGTLYSINWVPLGGFVKIKGENGEDSDAKDSFASKKIWKRISVLSAGVTMNVLLAAILLSIGLMIGLPQALDETKTNTLTVRDPRIQVITVVDNSPAIVAGIEPGDSIVSVNNEDVFSITKINEIISENGNKEIPIIIRRGDNELEKTITPSNIEGEEGVLMGVSLVGTGVVSYPWYKAIIEGFVLTYNLLIAIVMAFYTIIRDLIIGTAVETDIAGPVGIAVLTGQVVKMGFIYVLQFAALLSLNLAIINFLPIPALDGGRVFFLLIEKIRGKALNARLEGIIHTAGFAFLMLLVVLVTFRDISKFGNVFAGLWGKITGLF